MLVTSQSHLVAKEPSLHKRWGSRVKVSFLVYCYSLSVDVTSQLPVILV